MTKDSKDSPGDEFFSADEEEASDKAAKPVKVATRRSARGSAKAPASLNAATKAGVSSKKPTRKPKESSNAASKENEAPTPRMAAMMGGNKN